MKIMDLNRLYNYLKNLNSSILLILIIVFASTLRMNFFVGFVGGDDASYNNIAQEILDGNYSIHHHHYWLRIGLIYPVVLFFSIFGINEFSSSLYPFLCSIGSIIVIFYIGKLLFNEKVGLLAAFMLSFFPLDVHDATKLFPDIPSAFFMSLSILFFLMGEKQIKNKTVIYFLLSGFFMGIAHLNKETGVLLVLFFMYYVLHNRKIKLNYIFVALGFLIIFGTESLFYYFKMGNLFFRFTSEVGNREIIDNFKNNPESMLSFWIYPRAFFISIYKFGFFYYFITISTIYFLIKKRKQAYIPIFWMLVLFFYLEFGTKSFSYYRPFTHLVRYLSIITIPAIIVLAAFLVQKRYLLRGKFLLFSIVFLLMTSLFFINMDMVSYEKAYCTKAIKKYLENQPTKMIYADINTASGLKYLFGYQKDDLIKTYNYHLAQKRGNRYPVDLNKVEDSYVIADWNRIEYSARRYSTIYPKIIYNPPQRWKLVKVINNPSKKSSYYFIKIIKNIAQMKIIPSILSNKILNTISNVLKGNEAVIYYVPPL